MSKQQIFDAWAPPSAIWSPWAKPVLFSQISQLPPEPAEAAAPEIIQLDWAADSDGATALVVDLDGVYGVNLALYLAKTGYRPVPLYNACPQPPGGVPLVDVWPIVIALAATAPALQSLGIPADAPPAFLLDANRNTPQAAPLPGVFDNRSISLPTDFPSAHLLLSRGIRRVIVIQADPEKARADLSHTLRRWQEAGLSILIKSQYDADPPRPVTIPRPPTFRLIWYNLLAKMGLKTNPLGGFGGRLPMPSSG